MMDGKPGRRSLWLAAIVSAFVIVIVGVFLAVRFVYQRTGDVPSMAASLPAELEAARREGLPLTGADLRRRPPVPPEQNAARYLSQLPEVVPPRGSKLRLEMEAVIPAVLQPGRTDADRARAKSLLRALSQVFTLAEKAGRMPMCDFERNWDLGPELNFPEYGPVREASRLLVVRATLYADAGQPEQAFSDIRLGARLGQHVGQDPCLIGMLVRIAVESIMGRGWERILMEHMADARYVRAARECLDIWGPLPDLAYSMRGEVVMARASIRMVRGGQTLSELTGQAEDSETDRKLRRSWTARMLCDAWEARILAYERNVFATLRRYRSGTPELAHAIERLDKEADANAREHRVSTLALEIIRPVWSQAADKITETDARRALRRGLLDIAEYRLRTGRLPSRAAELGKPLPTDPYSGKPLLLRRKGKELFLYSVGRNGRDDGGEPPPIGATGPAPDITLVYPPRGTPPCTDRVHR